jgi:hypothetical protein
MRWYILRTLWHKEVLRHLANRGGLVLAGVLVGAALLLSLGGPGSGANPLAGGVGRCYVDYWEDSAWIDHLRRHVPADLGPRITFRKADDVPTKGGVIVYPAGDGAIQVRVERTGSGPRYRVWVWHSGADDNAMAPFEAWFWKESYQYIRQQTGGKGAGREISQERFRLKGAGDHRSALASALVLFALFLVCVYLLPALACEERERGVLLAQALTPASPLEILAARFLFYPVLGVALAVVVAGVYQPAVLCRPFFWLALAVSALGAMGVGLTVASLAPTQRAASLGALSYLVVVALILVVCRQAGIGVLPWLALEDHCPRVLQAALGEAVGEEDWWHLAAATGLALGWTVLATALFRRRGWQ